MPAGFAERLQVPRGPKGRQKELKGVCVQRTTSPNVRSPEGRASVGPAKTHFLSLLNVSD